MQHCKAVAVFTQLPLANPSRHQRLTWLLDCSHRATGAFKVTESAKRVIHCLQDEATVRELAEDDRAGDMTGWLQRLHAWLFEGDIFADVASNDVLLRIHSTAEEFEGAAEECFVPLQVQPAYIACRYTAPMHALQLGVAAHQLDVLTRHQSGSSPRRVVGLPAWNSTASSPLAQASWTTSNCLLAQLAQLCVSVLHCCCLCRYAFLAWLAPSLVSCLFCSCFCVAVLDCCRLFFCLLMLLCALFWVPCTLSDGYCLGLLVSCL